MYVLVQPCTCPYMYICRCMCIRTCRYSCLYVRMSYLGLCLCFFYVIICILYTYSGFGGLVVGMLASGTQDRGFDPGRSPRIFRAKKSIACLPWGGSKAVSPVADFARHVKEPWVYVEVEITGKIDRPFLARNSVFR